MKLIYRIIYIEAFIIHKKPFQISFKNNTYSTYFVNTSYIILVRALFYVELTALSDNIKFKIINRIISRMRANNLI